MGKKCLIGFDGYRDEIFRPVQRRTAGGISYWERMDQLGEYLRENSGRSADIELCMERAAYGGNGPLMAGAMAALGAQVTCVGLLDGCEDLTETLCGRVDCISIGPASRSTALEFSDGKLMLGQLNSMELTWRDIRERLSPHTLRSLAEGCELIGIVNWSAFLHMNEILFHMEQEIGDRRRILFFDPADCSARSREDVLGLAALWRDFSRRHTVVLGCNRKEAVLLTQRCFGEPLSPREAGGRLAEEIPGGIVVVHGRDGAECFLGDRYYEEKADDIEKPKLLTGAGDHFNAGFCSGLLNGGSLRAALRLGNRCAGHYIRSGQDWEMPVLQEPERNKNLWHGGETV